MGTNIKAVIFDMGGVLLRSEDHTTRENLARDYGLSRPELEAAVFDSESAKIATVGKITHEAHWQNTFASLKVPENKQHEFEEMFWAGDRCDQSLVNFLRNLRPQYKTGLLSNAWSNAREMLTKKYECIDAFDVSMFSFEVGLAKPDLAIYRLILDRLQVKPDEAIFVDDFIANIEAANELGIHSIHFINRNQTISEICNLLQG